MKGSKSGCVALAAALVTVAPAPAVAATKNCGAVKGVSQTSITKVRTSSGTCTAAKSVAKSFARTRVAPKGYSCWERFTASTAANVTCTRSGPARRITFRVVWKGSMPLPPAVKIPPPSAG